MALGVRVEQVIRARVVLVDAPLDEPHAQHAGIEVEVLLRRTGNRGDVMQPVDASHTLSSILPASMFRSAWIWIAAGALLLIVIYGFDVGHGFVKDDFVWILTSRVENAGDVSGLVPPQDSSGQSYR